MTTGREFFDACCSFLGQPYSTAPGRTDPNSDHKDCSGLVAAGFEKSTGRELGAYVTVTQFDQAVQGGNVITYDEALFIVGTAILRPFDPYQGWGANGHIAVSDGEGGTIEATPPRVQRLSVAYNAPWSPRAIRLPGLDYRNDGNGGTDEPKQENLMERTVHNSDVGDDQGWWYFPPTGHGRPSSAEEAFLLRGTGVPTFNVPGPAIKQALDTRVLAYPPVPTTPPDPGDFNLSDVADAELVAETNRRVADGRLANTGVLVDKA